jgi:PAS domain S-box-containing protein
VPVAAKGLFITTYPLVVGGPWETIAYAIDGTLVILVGFGMVVFLLESISADTQLLIETTHSAFNMVSATGEILDWNNGAAKLLGYSASEVIGRNSAVLLYSPDGSPVPVVRPRPEHVGEERTVKVRHKDGSAIWVSATYRAIHSGTSAPDAYAVLVTDISGRKNLEEDRLRLAAAIEHSDDGVVLTDPSGIVIFANSSFRSRAGCDKPFGRPVMEYFPEGFRAAVQRALNAGAGWSQRTTRASADGREIFEDLRLEPIRIAGGAAMNFVVTTRNVTRESELEEQLRTVQKLDIVGRLAAGIAHDFNNVLCVVRLNSDLLSAGLGRDSPLHKQVSAITHATRRAAALTRRLLAAGGRQIAAPRVFNVGDVLRDVEDVVRSLMGEAVSVTLGLCDDLWNVSADRMQIEEVITNLALNARDAMNGRGALQILTANVTLEAEHAERLGIEQGAHVALTVKDDGCGMTPEVRRRLFQPFFTTKSPEKGTGLGLAAVAGIVHHARGAIEVRSEPGRGTEFTIYLPRADGAAEPGLLAPPRPARPSNPTCILLLDDDESVRDGIRALLELEGYEVVEAGRPAEALRMLAETDQRIDLLLSDVILPDMNGWDVARLARSARPGLPMVFMSGYSDAEIADRGASFEGIQLLQKPVSAHELLAAVARNVAPTAEVA